MSVDPAAAKAQGDADKAANAAQPKADASHSEATVRETDDSDAPLARQPHEAEMRKATPDADKAATAARRDQLAGLIPDFSKVQRGSLEIEGQQPLFGTALAHRALEAAAAPAVQRAASTLPDSARVVVTSEADLATSDATYHAVDMGLEQLTAAARQLLEETARERLVGTPIVGAIAAAVPGLLSLFSARRTVTKAQVTVDDLAAAAAAAGALRKANPHIAVVHDDFRLLPTGGIRDELATLSGLREQLAGDKLVRDQERVRITTDLATARKMLENPSGDVDKQKLELAQKQADGYEQALSGLAVRSGLVDSVCEAIDVFVASLNVVPEGDRRSPLTLALMRQQLHKSEDGPGFTHVLLVKAEGGSAEQTVDDRPLWFKDKFSVVVAASVTYMLMETAGSSIVAAGTASALAAAYGSIGSRFTLGEVTVGTL